MSAPLVVAGALLGALTGALVPRVAYRLSVERPAPARSACARCAARFRAGPAGWLRMSARCPGCGARLGPPVWSTSTATAVACGALAWALDPTEAAGGRATTSAWLALAAFVLTAVAGVLLAVVDLACLRLPDAVVLPVLAAVVALLGVATAVAGTGAAGRDLLRALAAALALSGGYLVLALLPGANLGLGDVKLCALLGLLLGWLSWGAVLLGALLPHLINGPVALALLLSGRAGRKTALPLGPALLAGALAAVIGHAVLRG
jgi:leader peptidase (prepilin peptidase)/N-methyltransferase